MFLLKNEYSFFDVVFNLLANKTYLHFFHSFFSIHSRPPGLPPSRHTLPTVGLMSSSRDRCRELFCADSKIWSARGRGFSVGLRAYALLFESYWLGAMYIAN